MLGTIPLESESHSNDLDVIKDNQELLARGHSDESIILDMEIHTESLDISIMIPNIFDIIQHEDPLSLIHPEPMDWENEGHTAIDTLPNDHAISIYLNKIEPTTTFTKNFSNVSSNQVGAKSPSRKSENKENNIRSNVENHFWQH